MTTPARPSLPIDVYVRVSRVGGREHLISPAEQERRARQLAADRGLVVGIVLTDLDQSGGKLDRPGLQTALRRVEARQSGGLIVAWLDRLSRDSEHALGLLRRIAEAGGHVYAPDAPEDMETPDGELMVGITFAFAQYVRKRARAGFERAKENAIVNGVPIAVRPAVGYRKREDRRLEPDPETAPVVREVFERRAAGAGPTALAAVLKASGVRTSQESATWSDRSIYQLIENRVYLGELHYGRDRRFVNTESHEPIVDLATWTAAQRPSATGADRLARTSQRSPWLLAGLIRCHACRYAMQGTTNHGNRIYRCEGRTAAGFCPAPARLHARPVEDAIVAAFWTLTGDLEAQGAPGAPDDLDALQGALTRAAVRLAQVESEDAQDALGDRWAIVVRERREARDAAAGELGRARAVEPVEPVDVVSLRAAWEQMETRDRRDLIAARIDTVAVRRDPASLVVYPAGTGPAGLPRRGFKRAPELLPFPDAPAGAVAVAV